MEAAIPTVSVQALASELSASWSAETSASSDWSLSVPSRGQCAVSALIVQDHFGGELLRALVHGGTHYWNRLPGGTEVDVTRAQFTTFAPTEVTVVSREYVLSFEGTRLRYEILKRRVDTAAAAQM